MNETRSHRHRKEPESASIGWFFLGLFIPMVGLILFLAWFHDHHRKAVRAGLGALTAFIVGLIASLGFAFFTFSEVQKSTQEPVIKQTLSSSHHHKKNKHSTSSSASSSHSNSTASDTSIQEVASSSVQQQPVKAPETPAIKSANTQPTKVTSSGTSQHSESRTSSVSSSSSSVSSNEAIATGTYTVKASDNLYRIAVDHGMTLSELLQVNGLSSGTSISAGQTLKVWK